MSEPVSDAYRGFDPAAAGTRPVLTVGDPGIDHAWIKRYRRGAAAAVLWYIAVPLLLIIGLASAWGPFGWLNTWQLRTFGSNSAVLLAIPFMPIAFLPSFVPRLCRVDRTTPFLLGMRQAFYARWGPRVSTGPNEASLRLRRIGRIAAAGAAIGAVALIGFGAKGYHDSSVPHPPLAEMSHAALTNPAAGLPDAIRVTGVRADRTLEWAHDYHVRRDEHHDVYFALRPVGASGTQPVALLELARTNPQYGVEIWNMIDPPGPREGIPERLDSWTAEQLRHAGFRLAPHVVVLDRRQLDGINPNPDPIDDVIFCTLASTLLFSGLMTMWITRRDAVRLGVGR